MSIRDILRQAYNEFAVPSLGVLCIVKDIDTAAHTCTCTPLDGDGDFAAVRYTPGLDPNGSTEMGYGMIVVPAINSLVMVQPMSSSSGYISMFSKCQSIQLLDGSRGGLVDVVNLVTRLNNLENKFNAHKHLGVSTGGGVSGTPDVTISPVTQRSDIENPNITQGNP